MKNIHTIQRARFIFIAIACALFFTGAIGIAHADTVGSQVSIASTGLVIVRDAKVLSVSGNTITVKTVWGSMGIVWTVETNGSTRFVPDATSADAIKSINPGDLIGFSGEIDMSSGSATVRASVVKDSALQKDSVVQTGTVLAVDTTGNSFTMEYGDSTTTVALISGAILTRDGNLADISDISAGDTVKVFGSFNTVTHTLSAEKITWKSASRSVSEAQGGIFAGLISWLTGNRGIFSVL